MEKLAKFNAPKKKIEETVQETVEAPARKYYTIGNRANKIESASPAMQEAAEAAVPKAMSQVAMDRNVASKSVGNRCYVYNCIRRLL